MRYHQYRYKFYLNARHAIYIKNKLGQEHPHTWEITLDTIKVTDGFIQFHHVEKAIEEFLGQYQDHSMNEIEPFTTLNPTLENICEYFKGSIRELLAERGWLLLKIEISETPSRSYMVDLAESGDVGEDEERIARRNPEEEEKTIDAIANEWIDRALEQEK